SIEIGARIGQHMDEDSTIIAMLVRIAIHAIMHRHFQHIVLSHVDDPDVLRLARRTQTAFGAIPNLTKALRGEVVLCRVYVDMIRENPDEYGTNLLPERIIFNSGEISDEVADAWEARMMQHWRRLFAITRANK